MKDDRLLEGLEFIDADLIEAADRIPKTMQKSKLNLWRAVALGAAAFVAAVAVLICIWWQMPTPETPTDIQLGVPEQTTAQQTSEPDTQTDPTVNTTSTPNTEMSTVPISISYLTLDVNPSIQFAVEDDLIVGCIALNDDGEYILSDLSLTGITIDEALPLVIGALIEQGYLATEDHAPVMLLSARGSTDTHELLFTAVNTAKNTLAEKEVELFIVSQEIENAAVVEQLAEMYGVSVGKMQYVLDILEKEAMLSLEEASSRSIVELFGMDIEKRLIEPPYKVGDYDEYGEKVLFVGSVESYVGYVPWDKLSEEYKNELSQMYTPEALAILAMPRVWTTMPNVVGLPVDEALELLYSRNIAPYICYRDSAEARAAGFTDGICFQQDTPQGWRWNSDASVAISILVSEG